METLSRPMKHSKDKRSSRHGSTKGDAILTNVLTSYGGMTGFVDEARRVGIVYLDFHKDFKPSSHRFHTEELVKYELQEKPVRWMEKWLNREAVQWNKVQLEGRRW